MQLHQLTADVLVAGGGLAGVCAALAAARNGAKVILVQDRPVLGGNASSEVRMHICGADQHGSRGEELAVEAREGGILEEIRLETCVRNPQRSASMFDLILYEKCRAEPNLTLLLNTAVTGATLEGNLIKEALAERHATEDRFTIAARVFIDCTGDGRLGAEAGASFRQGREGKEEYRETHAAEQADQLTLGSTLLFTARRHAQPAPFVAPPWARKFTEADLKLRGHQSFEYGYWWVEWGGRLDTIKDGEAIRDELLAIMLGVWDHIKNGPPGAPPGSDPHGAAHWALDWFGFLPGKRESRRFLGQYVLREQDLLESRAFEDAIAYGGWAIDLHPPAGVDAPDQPPFTPFPLPHLYDIPLRACVSRDLRNLMFAGRNISATHVAFASTRVMATCAVVGQGVGTAAAVAVRKRLHPAQLAAAPVILREIQQALLHDDAYLIGRRNDDPADYARVAVISASSTQPGGSAGNVISGQTRAVHGAKGAPPDRALADGATHRWMSVAGPGFPAWLELRWAEPIQPRQIQLIFDTGLHRQLTLSHSDHTMAQQVWGRPQPETVRDYTIAGELAGAWQDLVKVEDNYQRRRVHDLPAPGNPLEALRITVHATHGLDHARICEVRVY